MLPAVARSAILGGCGHRPRLAVPMAQATAAFACLTIVLFIVHASATVIHDLPQPAGVLRPRMPAPAFSAQAVINEEFHLTSLADYEGQWLVLLFYPFDFTFVCPTELVAFSEASKEFASVGAKIAAVSTDSHFTHLAWTRTPRDQGGLGKLRIPLIADVSKEISASYGVLVTDPEDALFGAALRGLFIIDPKGTIRSVQVNDENVGRSVAEVLRLVKAFQYADSHGQGCPANWQPGDEAITPNPDASKAFFVKWAQKSK